MVPDQRLAAVVGQRAAASLAALALVGEAVTTQTNRFETGGNGTGITIANSDDAGDPIFDDVQTSGTATLTYDNANVFEGTYAAKIATGASASLAYVEYRPTITTRCWARLYIYLTANPGTNHRILAVAQAGGTIHCSVQMQTTGILRVINAAGSAVATCANAVPLNTWVRVDLATTASATGRCTMSYRTGNASHPTEVVYGANSTGTTSIGRIAAGISGTTVANVTFWMDKFSAGNDQPTDLGVWPIGIGAALTGTTSVSPTFEQATVAGNLVVALVTSFTVQDPGAPSGWTAASDNGNGDSSYVYYKANCSASETAPTLSAGSATFMSAVLLEFSGSPTASPVDRHGVLFSNVASSPKLVTTDGVDSAVPEVAVFVTSLRYSMSATKTTSNSSNNTTTRDLGNNDATSIATHYRFSWGLTTANASALNDNFALTTTNLNASGELVLTFKQVGVSPPPPRTDGKHLVMRDYDPWSSTGWL